MKCVAEPSVDKADAEMVQSEDNGFGRQRARHIIWTSSELCGHGRWLVQDGDSVQFYPLHFQNSKLQPQISMRSIFSGTRLVHG